LSRRITFGAALLILLGVSDMAPAQQRLPPLQILKSPSPEVLARLFPATARRMGVEGAATLTCVIRRDGTMGECAVTGENPRGLGFGGAALVAMTYYQVDVDGPNAVQVSRRLPAITIRFALPPAGTR
jgi:hypothetical protein